MTAQIFLVEIGYIDASGVSGTLRFSSAPDFMTRPHEVPPNQPYPPRVLNAGNYERHCWQRGATRGSSQIGFGSIILANGDGALDFLLSAAIDGQPVTVRRGPSNGRYPQDFPPYFSGKCRRVAPTWNTMEIYVVDLLGDIGQASYQPRKFAGTNVGPVGVEGLPTDLQGKPKPKLRGTAVNFSPPCVNTSLLIYQIDDGTAKLPLTISGGSGPTALGVFDKRSPLTSGGSASLATIMAQSTTVAAGSFITYSGPEGWFLRVGSTPSRLTVTASEGALADRTVAQIVSRELMGVGGVCQGDILGVAEMDAKNPAEVGIWVGDEITLQPVLDSLLDSINGFLTDTRDGRLQLGILEDPAGMQPVFTVFPWMIKSPDGIKITPTSDPGVGILISAAVSGGQDRYLSSQDATVGLPCKLVKLLFDRNFTVLAGADLAGNAAADTSYVGLEYRTFATPADPSVMAKHASAPEFTCTTLLRNGADASKEAFRQARLRSVPRYVVEIPIDPEEVFAVGQSVLSVDLARGVLVKIPRFGWDQGKTFFCLGLIENTGDATTAASSTLLLWG